MPVHEHFFSTVGSKEHVNENERGQRDRRDERDERYERDRYARDGNAFFEDE